MRLSTGQTKGLSMVGVLIFVGCGIVACSSGDPSSTDDDSPTVWPDADADGLADVLEDEIGTDPAQPDTDLDGYLDGEEWFSFTDPLDGLDYEYTGGYGHFPYPDDLAGTGHEIGEVLADFALPDYYRQQVHLYSFYGNVIHLFTGADW